MHGNFLRCHARIVQPATEPHPLSAAVCRRPQVHRDAFNGALQQQRPLLANRASPKRPTDQSISSINAVIPLVNRTTRNQTRFLHGKKNCVHALALSLKAKGVRIVPETERTNDNAPSHRVYVGGADVGAVWPKRSGEGSNYLSVKLDDPSFNAPIYANLFDDKDAETYALIWSRSRKPNGC